jgi:pseudouridylate synthase / pseudouridine kinase
VLNELEASGLDIDIPRIPPLREGDVTLSTAQYVAVNDASKNLVYGLADMKIFSEFQESSHWLTRFEIARPKVVIVDGNWGPGQIHEILTAGHKSNARTIFEPVSASKAGRLFPKEEFICLSRFAKPDIITPNVAELEAIYAAAKSGGYLEGEEYSMMVPAIRDEITHAATVVGNSVTAHQLEKCAELLPYTPTILITLGGKGVLLVTMTEEVQSGQESISHRGGHLHVEYFPAAEQLTEKTGLVSVNGAGDTFVGAVAAGLSLGKALEDIIGVAQEASLMTLRSRAAVAEGLGVLGSRLLELEE